MLHGEKCKIAVLNVKTLKKKNEYKYHSSKFDVDKLYDQRKDVTLKLLIYQVKINIFPVC